MKNIIFIIALSLIAFPAMAYDIDDKSMTDSVTELLERALEDNGAGERVGLAGVRFSVNGSSSLSLKKLGTLDVKEMPSLSSIKVSNSGKRFKANLSGGLNISGRYEEIIEVPVLISRIYRGNIIKKDDIKWITISERKLRHDTILETRNLIGKAAKRMIPSNKPLSVRSIENPIIVEKGGLITMVYKSGNMELRTTGKALEKGSVGDLIRVKNSRSKAIILVQVMDNGEARVNYGDVISSESQLVLSRSKNGNEG